MLIPGILPVGLSLLAGRPKIGKSWLALDMSRAIASGSTCLGRQPTRFGNVLYLALEDGDRRLQSRLRQMLVGSPAPTNLSFATSCRALDDGGADDIRAWCDSVPNPLFIVADVFQRIRPRPRNGGRLYADDYEAALPLKAIADERGIGVLAVVHCGKRDCDDDPLDAVSATTGLTGAVDHALILSRNKQGVTLYGRGRDAAEFDLAVQFDPHRGLWRALGDAAEVQRSEQRNRIIDALKEAGEPLGPKAIADASGVDHGTVRHLVGKMVEAGDLVRTGSARAGRYSIPPHSIPSIHTREGEEGQRVSVMNGVKGTGGTEI
jgi:AAA domain/IclR helix-turn-helix domain